MDVKLYLADARELSGRLDKGLELLTPKRREETKAFVEEKDRLLHLAAGLLLHSILGVTQDSDLVYGEFDKPELADGRICFSLSHAGCYAVLAVSERPVGVDIEPIAKPQVLPRKMLTAEEIQWLEDNPSPEDFCLLWTRLESALKAEGCGLALEQRAFSLLSDGTPWFWDTLIHDGHLLTCAGMSPLDVQTEMLSVGQLLK